MSSHDNDIDFLNNLSEQIAEQDDTPVDISDMPDWVSKDNYSYAGYVAIHELAIEKRSFIARGKFTRRTRKNEYTMTQREVAQRAGVKDHQTLFSGSYKAGMNKLFKSTNEELRNSFEEKKAEVTPKYTGSVTKTKKELLAGYKEAREEAVRNKSEMVDMVYARLLRDIPDNIKRKLRLK
ncbi:hypothetical protein BIZ37_04355 [Photobacterium sp. BZF1]|uniref:hypothetical protein n=1 Tax=Photobacterium sp. BZF1 TaxID=1904457 RepID=UPI001653BBB2|nr:hypothetical protein [Photobacterium sp. BZF1]MBC7001776.1 hypothetical protein [Photobacterium sp. BZF1]